MPQGPETRRLQPYRESGLPAPEPEEPPQPAPMISAVVTGFAETVRSADHPPVRQTGNNDDDLEPLYRLAVQHQSVTALVTGRRQSGNPGRGQGFYGDIGKPRPGLIRRWGGLSCRGCTSSPRCARTLCIPVTVEDQSRRSSPQWNPGTLY